MLWSLIGFSVVSLGGFMLFFLAFVLLEDKQSSSLGEFDERVFYVRIRPRLTWIELALKCFLTVIVSLCNIFQKNGVNWSLEVFDDKWKRLWRKTGQNEA